LALLLVKPANREGAAAGGWFARKRAAK